MNTYSTAVSLVAGTNVYEVGGVWNSGSQYSGQITFILGDRSANSEAATVHVSFLNIDSVITIDMSYVTNTIVVTVPFAFKCFSQPKFSVYATGVAGSPALSIILTRNS